MKRLYERIEEAFNNLSDRELVEVWNSYCDNSYDGTLYSMSDAEEIIDFSRPHDEVEQSLSPDFDTSDDYFYEQGNGEWLSTSDIWEVIDLDLLVKDYTDNPDSYDVDFDIEDEFEEAMQEALGKLSDEELLRINKTYDPYYDSVGISHEELAEAAYDAIWEERYHLEYKCIYQCPENVQEVYFSYNDACSQYVAQNVTANIKSVGPVPAERALEIAGFKKDGDGYTYNYQFSNMTEKYDIQIKDGAFKSIQDYAKRKKETSISR